MKAFALAAALLLLPVSARAEAPLDHGTFGHSCAPWDGAAVRFEITPEGTRYPQIGLSFYTGADKVETGSYDLPLDSHKGGLNYCPAEGKCQLPKKGEVKLIDFAPWTTAHISYEITLDDGTVLKGDAALSGSDKVEFCG
jgi:hypothetical protein